MSIDNLLNRLDRVKKTGHNRWVAASPTRDEKTPSLAIRELDDGRILLHDFGGSSTNEILAACGLTFDDLFPEKLTNHGKSERKPFFSHDMFKAVITEVRLVYLCALDITKGKTLSPDEIQRLALAAERIHNAFNLAGGA